MEKVQKVLNRMEEFKDIANDDDHFKTVTRFLPVIGARSFSSEVDAYCQDNGISQVRSSSSGSGYLQVIIPLQVKGVIIKFDFYIVTRTNGLIR